MRNRRAKAKVAGVENSAKGAVKDKHAGADTVVCWEGGDDGDALAAVFVIGVNRRRLAQLEVPEAGWRGARAVRGERCGGSSAVYRRRGTATQAAQMVGVLNGEQIRRAKDERKVW